MLGWRAGFMQVDPVSIETGNYTVLLREYFVTSRNVSAGRADLEHIAVVARLEGNAELPASGRLGHDRSNRHDILAAAVVKRCLYACLLAELDQVARGRERQLEAAALAALQRLARRHPDRVGGFLAIMCADLFRRRGGEEEPGVEPFWHAFRRDPVRIGHEYVERQHHAVIG